ncbi:MAG TPA: ATP-binding protein [Thermoanaerobaculia bacterium]|nr:ATP-binding protein [Thermoanaerobaculia bacterium]
MTRNAVGICLIYLTLVGGYMLWQREEMAAVRQAALKDAAHSSHLYDRGLRRLGIGALGTLSVAGGLALALYLLLVRRSREVAEVLEGALAGEKLPVPQVKDDFAVAFAAADRVRQQLHLERERGAQARHRLSALSLVMDVGVLLVEVSRQLEFANPRACELLGCADTAELERRWPEIRRLFEPALGPVERRVPRLDLDVPGPAGPRAVRCQVYTLGEEADQVFLFLLRDRVMLDALETDLLLASQLRALTRVYHAVTHDLKAPLNAMVLNLDLLQSALRRGEGAREAEQSEGYLDVLREELERLDRSLLTLLAETTPAGRGREEFDARAMVEEIERLLLPQARMQHVALEARLPGTALRIAGQRDRLKQAILNVAINALEAMSDGGALELRLEALPEHVEVLITDSGPGIPENLRQRIFDMHFTTKTSGTGIGLYVARSIVEAHGGEISVGSAPGRGSEFRLRVPALR